MVVVTKTDRKLVPAKNAKRAWSSEDEAFLQDKWGIVSVGRLAKALGRSESAVICRARRLKLGAHLGSGNRVPLNQLTTAIYGYTVSTEQLDRLIKNGLPVKTHLVRNNRYRVIDPDDFWRWAEKNKHLLNFARFEPFAIGPEPDWAKEKRRYDQNLRTRVKKNQNEPWSEAEDARLIFLLKKGEHTYTDLQRELHRTESAIKLRIRKLGIKDRPVRQPIRRWTEEQIETLLQMVEAGADWIQIGEAVGHSAMATRGKMERLQNPERDKQCNRGGNKKQEYTKLWDMAPDEIRRVRNLTKDIELGDAHL